MVKHIVIRGMVSRFPDNSGEEIFQMLFKDKEIPI